MVAAEPAARAPIPCAGAPSKGSTTTTADPGADHLGARRPAAACAELRKLDAGYRFVDPAGNASFRGRGVSIPTLDEVLDAFPVEPHHMRRATQGTTPLYAEPETAIRLPLPSVLPLLLAFGLVAMAAIRRRLGAADALACRFRRDAEDAGDLLAELH